MANPKASQRQDVSVTELHAQIEEMEGRVSEYRTELHQKTRELKNANECVADMKSGYDRMERERDKAIRDYEVMKQLQLKDAKEFPALMKALRENVDVLRDELATFKREKVPIAKSSKSESKEKPCTQKACLDAKKKCEELENEKVLLIKDLRTAGNLSATMKGDLDNSKRECDNSKRRIQELIEKKEQLEEKLKTLEKEAERFEQERSALTHEDVELMTKATDAMDKMGKEVNIKIGENAVVGAGGSEGENSGGGGGSDKAMDIKIGDNTAVAVAVGEGGSLAVGKDAQAGSTQVQPPPSSAMPPAPVPVPYGQGAMVPVMGGIMEFTVYTLCHCKGVTSNQSSCVHKVTYICLCGERFYNRDAVVQHQQKGKSPLCSKGMFYEMANTVVKSWRPDLPAAPSSDKLPPGAAAFLNQLQKHLTTQENNIDNSLKQLDKQRINMHLLSQEIYRFLGKNKNACNVM